MYWINSDVQSLQKNLDPIYLNQHHHNAITHVKNTGIIYDAIYLAQNKHLLKWAAAHNQAENHPAILMLAAFWECYQLNQSPYVAAIPYLQLFLNEEHYVPLVPMSNLLPVKLEDSELQTIIKKSSVIFGNEFLITYLASANANIAKRNHHECTYYTVYGEPILAVPKSLDFEKPHNLAWLILKALHDFPRAFPGIWQELKTKHGGETYEIH